MASTGGGFLLGVGVCVFLLSIAGYIAVETYYTPLHREIMGWKDEVQTIYDLTHNPVYRVALDAVRGVADVVSAFSWVPGLGGFADGLNRAAETMEQMRSTSETAYYTLRSLELYPPDMLLTCTRGGFLVGFIFIATAVALILRGKKAAGEEKAGVPPISRPGERRLRVTPERIELVARYYCPKCGSEVDAEGDFYCPFCGQKLVS